MITARSTLSTTVIAALALALSLALPGSARAHCDTMNGPLVPEAKAALEKGDVTPVLKWVKADKEPEIKQAFAQAVTDRAKDGTAREAADKKFLETLVRIHREGEGAEFTGLKDERPEPIVAMSDAALAAGSVDDLTKKMSAHMTAAIKEKFDRVVETAKDKDTSVEQGREWVEAYVTYMHYIEGIHAAIMSAGGHSAHTEPAAAHSEHKQ